MQKVSKKAEKAKVSAPARASEERAPRQPKPRLSEPGRRSVFTKPKARAAENFFQSTSILVVFGSGLLRRAKGKTE